MAKLENIDGNDADDEHDECDGIERRKDFDEISIADSDIRSINVMIYDDVESVVDFNLEDNEDEKQKLNNNKLNEENVLNKVNYINDYILTPFNIFCDYFKRFFSFF